MEKQAWPETGTALLEIGTEELPVSFFYGAIEQIKALAEKKLGASRLAFERLRVYGTPRRLVLEIAKLVSRQPDETREVRGPAKATAYDSEGRPTQALLGFLKGQGASPESVEIKEVSGKPYVFARIHHAGKATRDALAEIFPEIIRQIAFPKSMRWNGDFHFGRPIRWILAMFEDQVIPFELAGQKSGNFSRGHRFLSSGPMRIPHPSSYSSTLKKGFVIPDQAIRAELIRNDAETLAGSRSAKIYRIDSLLEEVALLVEYPTPFLGRFEERFLSLPQDVLITVMQHHQRYFPLIDTEGKLLHYFVAVRNGNEEGLDNVTAGNEQVLRARFKDAEYFFSTDKKRKLMDRVQDLDKLVFQKNLGTMRQKVERLKGIVRLLHKDLSERAGAPGHVENQTDFTLLPAISEMETVVLLAKGDLTTQMVFELPELQGVMGKEYARREGYPEWMCQAILDHYLPRFQGDDFPKTLAGALLGIADRIDTLVGCFALNLKPSGSSDPLGLRRAATTLLQILAEKNLDFDLAKLADEARIQYNKQSFQLDFTWKTLESFILERCETVWKAEGIHYDLFRTFQGAITGEPAPQITPLLLLRKPLSAFRRAQFLERLRDTQKEKFVSFVLAWTRVFNILKAREAQAILQAAGGNICAETELWQLPEEKNLFGYLQKQSEKISGALAREQIQEGFDLLSSFQGPINAFFDKVLVMDPDENVRRRRLALLWNLQVLMLRSFGDLTQIVLA